MNGAPQAPLQWLAPRLQRLARRHPITPRGQPDRDALTAAYRHALGAAVTVRRMSAPFG